MLASWPVLLMHDLVGIGLLFLMLEIRQQWKAVWSFEPRWSRELAQLEAWPAAGRQAHLAVL